MNIKKYLSMIFLTFVVIFILRFDDIKLIYNGFFDKSLVSEFEKEINDTQATTGVLDIQGNWELSISDKLISVDDLEYLEASPELFLEGADAYTQEQYDSLITYYKEYIKMLEALTKYDVNKVTGEFYGVCGSDDSVFPGVFIYKFESIPQELKEIDYKMINDIYNQLDLWHVEDTPDNKMLFLQKDNYLINIMGEYCDNEEAINKIILESIK